MHCAAIASSVTAKAAKISGAMKQMAPKAVLFTFSKKVATDAPEICQTIKLIAGTDENRFRLFTASITALALSLHCALTPSSRSHISLAIFFMGIALFKAIFQTTDPDTDYDSCASEGASQEGRWAPKVDPYARAFLVGEDYPDPEVSK